MGSNEPGSMAFEVFVGHELRWTSNVDKSGGVTADSTPGVMSPAPRRVTDGELALSPLPGLTAQNSLERLPIVVEPIMTERTEPNSVNNDLDYDEEQEAGMKDRMTFREIRVLEELFTKSKSKKISREEYSQAFQRNKRYVALMKLYKKIDSDSDGYITWDEVMLYELKKDENLGNMERATFKGKGYHPLVYQPPTEDEIQRGKNAVKKFIRRPNKSAFKCVSMSKIDRYLSISPTSGLSVWTGRSLVQGMPQVERHESLKTETWLTDVCPLFGGEGGVVHQKAAVASVKKCITIYSISATHFRRDGIAWLTYTPTALDYAYWERGQADAKAHAEGSHLLAVGSGCGSIYLYDAVKLRKIADKNVENYDDTLPSAALKWKTKCHDDWVTGIQIVTDFNLLISSSIDGTLKTFDFDRQVIKRSWVSERGITGFAYSKTRMTIATMETDSPQCKLWHQSMAQPVALLEGHDSPLVSVAVAEADNNWITMDGDYILKVWDFRNFSCIQTIVTRQLYPVRNMRCLLYDDYKKYLLTFCDDKPVLWSSAMQELDPWGHQSPVVAAAYSDDFETVISIDEKCTMCLWDLSEGTPTFRVDEPTFLSGKVVSHITCARLDQQRRRLITGDQKGNISIWNINSGSCVYELKSPDGYEITSVYHTVQKGRQFVLSVGWNKKVNIWRLSQETHVFRLKGQLEAHKNDIMDVDFMAPNQIATCSSDGEVIVWFMESVVPRCTMRIEDSQWKSKNKRSLEKVRFLGKGSKMNVLVTCGNDGHLRFWDSFQVRQVFSFEPDPVNSVNLTCIEVDSTNSTLFCGDTYGRVWSWDLENVGMVNPLDQNSEFDSSSLSLMYTWTAHTQDIVSIEYIEDWHIVLTASRDCGVAAWTFDGKCIGNFGQEDRWLIRMPEEGPPDNIAGLTSYLTRSTRQVSLVSQSKPSHSRQPSSSSNQSNRRPSVVAPSVGRRNSMLVRKAQQRVVNPRAPPREVRPDIVIPKLPELTPRFKKTNPPLPNVRSFIKGMRKIDGERDLKLEKARESINQAAENKRRELFALDPSHEGERIIRNYKEDAYIPEGTSCMKNLRVHALSEYQEEWNSLMSPTARQERKKLRDSEGGMTHSLEQLERRPQEDGAEPG